MPADQNGYPAVIKSYLDTEIPPSCFAEISAYSLPGQTGPAFINSSTGTISVTVAYGVNITALAATFTTSLNITSIKVGAVNQVSGVTANNFTNQVNYVVTAQDGTTTKNWQVTVTIAPASVNATLSSLILSSGVLSPAFTPATTSYAASVDYSVTSITVKPTCYDSQAAVKVNGTPVVSGATSGPISLNIGSNTIIILVTAQDGSTGAYTVTVTRAAFPAGSLTWNYATPPPATASNFQMTANTQASLFAIAPDGVTIFAWDKNYGQLYKSNNAGITWTTTNIGSGINFSGTNNGVNITGNAPVVAIAVSPNYVTDTTVLVATGTTTGAPYGNLYSSNNGGQNFLLKYLAPIALTAPIVSIDLAPYFISTGGMAMMVATRNEIALYSDDYGWRIITGTVFTGGSTAGQATNFARGKILAAQFSPMYQLDGEILAVVTGVLMGGMTAPGTIVETLFANSPWNATVQPTNLISTASYTSGSISTNNIIASSATATATFAFPGDYNSSATSLNRVYVTIGDSAGTWAPGNSANVASTGFDVWRINGSINSSGTVVNASQLMFTDDTSPANNASLAYTGTAANGTLVVGEYGTGGIWYNTRPNSNPIWTQASSGFVPGNNVGQNVFLAFPASTGVNPHTLYVATDNRIISNKAWGSAFFSSTDYNSYKALSLISVPDINKVTLAWPTGPIDGTQDQYLGVTCNYDGPIAVLQGDIQMVFKSTDNGATWAEVFGIQDTVQGNTAPPLDVVGQALNNIFPSPTYATDHTLYVTQTDKTIWRTRDAGATWDSIVSTTPNNSLSGFGLIDASTYWLGSNQGGIYKSGSYTQVATLDGTIPFQIFNLPFGVVVNTWTGEVYLSIDQGATFTRLGNFLQFSNGGTAGAPGIYPGTYINDRASLAFDVPNKTIYAANSTSTISNIIYKWTVGTDTAWVNWTNLADKGPISFTNPVMGSYSPNISSLVLADDGTLYIRVPNTAGIASNGATIPAGNTPQLLRCVDLTSAPSGRQTFVAIPQTDGTASDFNNGTFNLPSGKTTWVFTDATNQNNTIYQIISNQLTTTQTGYPTVIKSYIDILIGKPTVTAPQANARIGTTYNFAWNAILSNQQITYQVEIAADDQFNGRIVLPSGGPNNIPGQTTAASMNVTGLIPGTQYYFRVCTMLPLPSRWSDTIPFIVRLGIPDQVSPVSGATNVPLTPAFQWPAVTDADTYDFKLSLNFVLLRSGRY